MNRINNMLSVSNLENNNNKIMKRKICQEQDGKKYIKHVTTRIRKEALERIEERKKWKVYGKGKTGELSSIGENVKMEYKTLDMDPLEIDRLVPKLNTRSMNNTMKMTKLVENEYKKINEEIKRNKKTSETVDVIKEKSKDEQKTLFLTNIDNGINRYQIKEAFEKLLKGYICPITSVVVPVNRETGETRGFAFVDFRTREVAEKALERSSNIKLGNYIIDVNFSRLY